MEHAVKRRGWRGSGKRRQRQRTSPQRPEHPPTHPLPHPCLPRNPVEVLQAFSGTGLGDPLSVEVFPKSQILMVCTKNKWAMDQRILGYHQSATNLDETNGVRAPSLGIDCENGESMQDGGLAGAAMRGSMEVGWGAWQTLSELCVLSGGIVDVFLGFFMFFSWALGLSRVSSPHCYHRPKVPPPKHLLRSNK